MTEAPTSDNQNCPPAGADMRCEYCHADTREAVVQSAFWTERGWMIVQEVPARVCEGCGEQFYSEATTRQLQELLDGSPAKAKRHVLVPVFSLARKSHTATRKMQRDGRVRFPGSSKTA